MTVTCGSKLGAALLYKGRGTVRVSKVKAHLTEDDVRSGLQERFGQGSGSRADLQHEVAFIDPCGLHDLSELVVVMEEILAKAMLRPHPMCVKK